ncbi:transcriptional regulator family: Fungal Specific TF [Penicillium hispanicum]|uniref:transcriptional regulator family: Fungal Specific TF n=1 Tax=Penicillium hispanicum TaxID=1080232 RepID=UPI002541720A|nr:transcriptional regulator family: Fungal Specific TF [Penicillium hispanicum]KAJ5573922.1 transcriptional regulator family: Fungal Specific TF [Penicillium hispanicum]
METGEERPYRSHIRPACLPCRRRKSRCKIEAHCAVCLMCRAHNTDCSFPTEKRRKASRRMPRGTPRGDGPLLPSLQAQAPLAPPMTPVAHVPSHQFSGASASPASVSSQPIRLEWTQAGDSQDTPLSLEAEDDNPHVVGPAVMGDSHVLAGYLSSFPGGRGMRSIRPVEPGSSSSPIVFTKVQKRPLGLMLNSNPALHKLQIIEKLIEPWSLHLVDLYLKKINPCFPLLDETTFRAQYLNAKDRISPALLSCLYGHVLPLWRYDPELSRVRAPDDRFIWNQACEAVYSELHLSPGISTITAILLNVGGRPTTSMIGNGVQLGSAIALCHSLGLNRNPLPWDIPRAEKHLRMKIWWSILIHDRWSSLAYGTPPHIRRSQYDVPLPTHESLSSQIQYAGAHEVFIALTTLTEVLDFCLEYVYSITVEEPARDLDLELNKWVDTLTGNVRKIITRGIMLEVPGASNLRLAYLAVKLLLRRIYLDRERQTPNFSSEKLANHVMDARRTAEDIVVLVQELREMQLGDFWLPVAAFTFVSTVTFLIRCALETEQSSLALSQSPSLRMAAEFLSSLRSLQQNFGWDLADICLAQHSDVVEKLMTSTPAVDVLGDTNVEPRQHFMPDMAFIDAMFPSIWDTLQSM